MNRLPKNPHMGSRPGRPGGPKQARKAFQKAPGELQARVQELEHRVVERTAELEKAVRTLEVFCHSVAHDLRAPLRTMHGFASLLLSHYAAGLDARGQDYSRRICASAEHMDQFLSNLLAFGRISSVRLPLQTLDTEALANSAAEDLLKAGTGAAGRIEIKSPLPPVHGNPTLLEHVLTHLLSNALKFVAPGVSPRVRIWAESGKAECGMQNAEKGSGHPASPSTLNPQPSTLNRSVRLWVEDNGIGIPADLQAGLFHAFGRLHGERYPGTGIGLAIVQKAVEQMQGVVGVDSEPGKGSRFWVQLPAAHP
jgi:signal transduction histidine kinase